jgi:hypothetical protein
MDSCHARNCSGLMIKHLVGEMWCHAKRKSENFRKILPSANSPILLSLAMDAERCNSELRHANAVSHHLPALQLPDDGNNANRRLPLLLRMQGLRPAPSTQTGPLLRLLLLRLIAMSACSGGTYCAGLSSESCSVGDHRHSGASRNPA